MLTRLVVGLSTTAMLATGILVGSASVAQAKCVDWKEEGLDPNYCYISRTEAHVWATFVNDSDREVHITAVGGLDRKNFQQFDVRPGKKQWLVGNASSGVDVIAVISWCPTVSYREDCAGKLSAELTWKNPWAGWPWMKVDKDEHDFRAMERYTFEKAFGSAGSRGVAKFKSQRLTDLPSGTKVYNVHFSFAAR